MLRSSQAALTRLLPAAAENRHKTGQRLHPHPAPALLHQLPVLLLQGRHRAQHLAHLPALVKLLQEEGHLAVVLAVEGGPIQGRGEQGAGAEDPLCRLDPVYGQLVSGDDEAAHVVVHVHDVVLCLGQLYVCALLLLQHTDHLLIEADSALLGLLHLLPFQHHLANGRLDPLEQECLTDRLEELAVLLKVATACGTGLDGVAAVGYPIQFFLSFSLK